MKRKIVIVLSVYSVVSIMAGLYVAFTIRTSMSNLDRLVELHHVEILREHYLIQMKGVHSDLALSGTTFSKPIEGALANVEKMGKLIDTCFNCHHSEQGTQRLKGLKERTNRYVDILNHLAGHKINVHAYAAEKKEALIIGEGMIHEVWDMIGEATKGLDQSRKKTMKEISDLKYILYSVLMVGPLLTALLGYIFISDLTRPLTVLLESTRKIKGGDLEHRAVELGGEFGELAASFNEMADSLREQIERRAQNEKMAVCGELAAGLAHEVRNPLAGIKAATQTLDRKARLSEKERAITWRIIQEVGRLETLMDGYLNFTKPPKPRFAQVDVNQIVNAILSFHVKADSFRTDEMRGILINKELQSIPKTMADPVQLHQIVLNIILNAVESMPNGGSLNVRTSIDRKQGSIGIEIMDTGKGIGTDYAHKIFEPFFTTKRKGSGLGLAISKRLIEQHGGYITVGSNNPGGTIFRIHLPWKPPEEEGE